MISFVPTPIGNKEDITLRAIRLLKESQIFLCEDTRTAKKLCNLYDISLFDKQFFPLTGFTQQHAIQRYCNTFRDQQVVVLSEAGTPGLSDPGKMLVKRLWYYQIPYEVLP
jgi:16S rRNA (cytidine1402-2'-O)-methyltransferase